MHIPKSTYRIQFTSSFPFSSALEIVPYLSELGISDLYASPILKARKGSAHGYDVVDPTQLNPELGSQDEFDLLISEIKKNNMSWLQDIVPNHMAYSHENQMLIDLLENGQYSRFFNSFDIEWHHPHHSVRDRVLAPFLGKYYQECLENGELVLKYGPEGLSINYFDYCLPLKMESYNEILSFRLGKLTNRIGKNNSDMIKYLGVLYVAKSLPVSDEFDERYSQIMFLKAILWELYSSNQEIKVFVDENLKIYNGEKGNPESFNNLDKLLSDQYFRLAYWKVANEEINYRRFFNVSDLISLRVENPETFYRVHSLILKFVKEEKIQGLRIDHIDGLYDPLKYLQMLQERAKDVYIIVEKILELEEKLPENWPVNGTSGYDFTNFINGIFCKRENEKAFSLLYSRFIKYNPSYERIVYDKKRLIIQARMAGEVERLAFIVEAVSSKDRYGIDITMHGLKRALEEILTVFPIYRTYMSDEGITERDFNYIEAVQAKVLESSPGLRHEIEYICNLLKLNFEGHFSEEQKKLALDFVMKFQQLTGPLMAKGFEDTALYVYNRFISLNEVGGNPGRFGIELNEYHKFMQMRNEKWPWTMNASSTHDTKRGEDIRARLNVLSEIPGEWEDKIKLWSEMNAPLKETFKGLEVPEKNEEYFLYQVLTGSYPLAKEDFAEFIPRIKEFLVKASREAKTYSSWLNPNEEYEKAFQNFAEKILMKSAENKFFDDFFSFQTKIAHYGLFNALSQTLIRLTSPGVPDIYQGSEMWNFSLVDPDNRRPVDFDLRKKYLREIKEAESANTNKYLKKILNSKNDGRIKLYTIYKVLNHRNNNPGLFLEGSYIPLNPEGNYGNNVIAFARKKDSKWSITIVPRFLTELIDEDELPLGIQIWGNTNLQIPAKIKKWVNILTGETVYQNGEILIGDVFKSFPAAVLEGFE
jgi:(1->4)-alpha-D-glucan 1-alpha-D-glucosylmutase